MSAWPPHQMNAEQAAHHVGAPTLETFERWLREGLMPQPAKVGKYRLWLRGDLERAAEALHARPVQGSGRKIEGYDEKRIRKAQEAARGT